MQDQVSRLTLQRLVSARQWLILLGHMASMTDLIPNCLLFLLHRNLLRKLIPVPREIKLQCPRWKDPGFLAQGKSLTFLLPTLFHHQMPLSMGGAPTGRRPRLGQVDLPGIQHAHQLAGV